MTKIFTFLAAAAVGLMGLLSSQSGAIAAPVTSLSVLQMERYLGQDPDIQKVHGWHCRARRGHYHPEACGGGGYDPYDPYDEPDDYYDPRYDDGGTFVVKPRSRNRRRARRNCSRADRRECNRNWRRGSKRHRRCLRKRKCR